MKLALCIDNLWHCLLIIDYFMKKKRATQISGFNWKSGAKYEVIKWKKTNIINNSQWKYYKQN